uniref:Uncharacterized protein n=1 Tax=Rhizophora mucronata TaxID=61149 RepID=A0A2P2JII7_RHIMU
MVLYISAAGSSKNFIGDVKYGLPFRLYELLN